MKKIILLIAVTILISLALKAQRKPPSIKVTVEFIEPMENGWEVWVKYHNPHYKYRSFHLVKTFSTLPDSIRIGKTLILLPSNDKNEFQVVGKK